MKRNMLILAGLIAGFLAAAPAPAQEIRYLGRVQGAEERGLIQLHGQHFTVGEGDEIPGVGTVHKMTDDALIVRRPLTEEEKERLQAEGRAVFDVEEQHIGSLQLRLAPRPRR
jgi:hypothetical protein